MVDSHDAGNAMRESQAIAQAFMNAPQDAVTILNGDGIILDANETVCERFGISRELLGGRPAWDFFPPHVAERRKAALEEAFQGSKVVRFEDGRQGRYFDPLIYPVVESDGRIGKFVVIARDITELKKTEKALEGE